MFLNAMLNLIRSLLPDDGKKIPVSADIMNESSFGQITSIKRVKGRILVDATIIDWDNPERKPIRRTVRNRSIRSFEQGVLQEVAMCLLEKKSNQ